MADGFDLRLIRDGHAYAGSFHYALGAFGHMAATRPIILPEDIRRVLQEATEYGDEIRAKGGCDLLGEHYVDGVFDRMCQEYRASK